MASRRSITHRQGVARHHRRACTAARPISARLEPVESLEGVPPLVSAFVRLSALLAGPGPSGSADPSRRCRGCSCLRRRLPAPAASSFVRLLRQPAGAFSHPTRSRGASWRTVLSFHGSSLSGSGVFGDPESFARTVRWERGPNTLLRRRAWRHGGPPSFGCQAGPIRRPQRERARRSVIASHIPSPEMRVLDVADEGFRQRRTRYFKRVLDAPAPALPFLAAFARLSTRNPGYVDDMSSAQTRWPEHSLSDALEIAAHWLRGQAPSPSHSGTRVRGYSTSRSVIHGSPRLAKIALCPICSLQAQVAATADPPLQGSRASPIVSTLVSLHHDD
jgi:hypothetical protein